VQAGVKLLILNEKNLQIVCR